MNPTYVNIEAIKARLSKKEAHEAIKWLTNRIENGNKIINLIPDNPPNAKIRNAIIQEIQALETIKTQFTDADS